MEMTDKDTAMIAAESAIDRSRVAPAIRLLQEGGTIPFIARYRKEQTGSLDELQIGSIADGMARLQELKKRKASILATLADRELLDDDLAQKIGAADNLRLLEDIYLPYKQKKKTRAAAARERGLEELALMIQKGAAGRQEARNFVAKDRGVATVEDALAGARDIIAEIINEDLRIRRTLRKVFAEKAVVSSTIIEKYRQEAHKFRDYFDWQESVCRIAGHRLLAIFRGEVLKYLRVSLRPDPQRAIGVIKKEYAAKHKDNNELIAAIEDSYNRLLAPSLENELRKDCKQRCDAEAIAVFAKNLEELLLAPALGQKRVIALDPGYRTGAKLVCLDEFGVLLHSETIFPTQGSTRAQQAAERLRVLVGQYTPEAIAIGNGTAGRETESFVRSIDLSPPLIITLVNEDGASIYSASEAARREFANEDITVRGAVSIGRRLQDPLAELVKIDPKSIGVGQYQHDVNQKALKVGLEEVVRRCVNRVGVEVNSASVELLSYVAGLGPTLAANIVDYRLQDGPFANRKELLDVARLGAKAFEQCAGFIRIRNGANPMDNSGVHPERYALVEQMAADLGVRLEDLLNSEQVRGRIVLEKYTDDNVGMETLKDIMEELARPGRDPRESFAPFQFDDTVRSMEDLRQGMVLPAIITNVTKFGAFADIGVKQDGLIHISQMAERYIKDPGEVVRVRQQVRVKVLEIDLPRKRIGLSLLL